MFRFSTLKKKTKLGFVAGLTVFGLLVGATGAIANNTVSASNCDKVNIIYCGLSGSSASGYIDSLRAHYNNNRDQYGNTDIRAVMRWSGFTDKSIAGMDTGNTKVGTLYRNGNIYVGGTLVGSKTWVSARFGAGQAGFKHVEGNVWARLTTTSFANDSVPVLIHFDGEGVPDAGVMVHCGNSLQFHPEVKPKPSLVCDSLTATAVAGTFQRSYQFTAKANAKHTTITNYVFEFGDGKSDKVKTDNEKATSQHTYAAGKTYTATVTVDSTDIKNVSSGNCKVKIEVPAPALSCDSLTAVPTGVTNEYQLTAKATPKNTTITGYAFDFGDGQKQTVQTGNTQATVTHGYAAAGQTYIAKVSVDSSDVKNVTSANCQVTIKTPVPPKPSVTITKLVDGVKLKEVEVGATFTYQLKVTNDGTMDLSNVAVTDTPAAGSNIQLVGAAVGVITGNTWNYTIPSLKAGESKTFELTAKVTQYTEGQLVNTACVNAPEVNPGQPEKQDACDTANVKVKKPQVPNVTITKYVDGVKYKQVEVGQVFTYQLKVTNTGEVDLKNVVVTDPAPAGVTMLTTDKGSIVNNALSLTIASLPVGQSVSVNITAKVAQQQDGKIVNTACVNAPEVNPSQPDKDDACDNASVSVSKQPENPNITITKYVGTNSKNMQVTVGVPFSYRLIVKNTGDINMTNVVVTDTPEEGIVLLSAEQGTITNNTWTYTIPSLAIGQQVEFTLTAKVTAETEDGLVNTACVNAPEVNPGQPDKDDACDTATVTTPTTPVTLPEVLPNTGAGSVIGLVSLVAIVSALGYRFFLSRRLAE